ncbi:MAG: choice-of-anchor D domain-containing protein [Alphaproteobacteria bacterium]|nr:choice-of-anchor D domain-containing protein [Alphaproteobacteria bacterium]NCQ87436.1 choice-of-anchor D domain-containing protein [Alphaproteobacteria bacterium]NCT06307.1 choice-of-anchor D domain-containing protein [Alphaproteobacteria bacterium]
MRYNRSRQTLNIIVVALFLTLTNLSAFAQSAFEDPGTRSSAAGETNAGGLVAITSDLDSGNVTLGSSSQIVLLFRNDSSKDVTMGAINLYPSSNVSASIAQNQCAQDPLAPDAICAIALQVKGLQPGRFRVEMLIRHDGRTKLITSTVQGLVDASDDTRLELVNDVEAIPQDLDFGSLNESRTQIRSIIFRNITSKKIVIEDIFIQANPQSGFSLDANCPELNTGEACVATVTWAPVQRGPATGVLIVKHDGPAAVASVTLDGTYEPDSASEAEVFPEAVPGKGLLTASQTDIDFGSGIESSSSITVSLVNVGDAPILLKNIRLSNDKNGIVISPQGCAPGVRLDPVEACPLTLTWEPTREGNILDDIQISHDGARGILVLPLRGNATKAINRDSEAIFLDSNILNPSNPYLSSFPTLPASALDLPAEEEEVTTVTETVKNEDGTETEVTRKTVTTKARAPSSAAVPQKRVVDLRGALDGYRITSIGQSRGIISGPGGSRVVFNGEQAVIGGILWDVTVRASAIEFGASEQKVLLLFDRSLTTFNANGANSNEGTVVTTDTATTDTDN